MTLHGILFAGSWHYCTKPRAGSWICPVPDLGTIPLLWDWAPGEAGNPLGLHEHLWLVPSRSLVCPSIPGSAHWKEDLQKCTGEVCKVTAVKAGKVEKKGRGGSQTWHKHRSHLSGAINGFAAWSMFWLQIISCGFKSIPVEKSGFNNYFSNYFGWVWIWVAAGILGLADISAEMKIHIWTEAAKENPVLKRQPHVI